MAGIWQSVQSKVISVVPKLVLFCFLCFCSVLFYAGFFRVVMVSFGEKKKLVDV